MPNTVEPDWQERLIQFVYELLSPAILGSMIYDMFRPEDLARLVTLDADNPLWKNGQFLSRVLILCLFCMTWLYHRKSRGQEEGMERWRKSVICWIDFFGALAFPVAFVFVGKESHPYVTPAAILFIASLYCVAQRTIWKSFWNRGAFTAIAAMIFTIVDLLLHRFVSHNWCDLPTLAAVAGLYLYFLVKGRPHRNLGQPMQIDMSLAMATPDWLQARKGLLQPVARLDAVFVMLEGHPFFKLEARPAAGKFACAVSQTNNGKRLDDPSATYPDIDTAFAGGLDQLRNALGW